MGMFTSWLFNADKGEDLRFLVADLPGGLWKERSSPDSGKSSPVPWPSFPGGGDTGEENRHQSPAALLDRGDDTNPDPDTADESDDTPDNIPVSDQHVTGPEETDSPTLSSSQTSSLTTVTSMGSSESLYSVTESDTDPSDHPESSTPSGPAAEGSPAEEEGIPRWMLNDLQVAADERGYRVNLSEGHLRGGFGLVLFGSVGAKRLLRHKEVMDAAVHNGHNKVAFKIIQHSFMLEGKTIEDESQMSSIKAEMKVLERTRTKPHVNILNLYDVWINQLIVVLVCPKAERFDLSYYVERNKPCCCLSRQRCTCTSGLPEGVVRALFSQIINGLRYLHRKGIYHRGTLLHHMIVGRRFYNVPCSESNHAQTRAVLKQIYRWRGRPPINREFISSEPVKLIYGLTNEEGNRRIKLKAVQKSPWLLYGDRTAWHRMEDACLAHRKNVLTTRMRKEKDPEKLRRIQVILTSMEPKEKPRKKSASEDGKTTATLRTGEETHMPGRTIFTSYYKGGAESGTKHDTV
ncbi:Hypp3681 [Branchiostoma lanceolatum]|uniref:non-specific serine/threonine protein kinase n=1 Tax=Branchiostoma lanceolatum TaxID=7740 RepID=A0A8K0A0Q3_BRALA|nr:Hypp3681 [Branchiostoma lanceolatum]